MPSTSPDPGVAAPVALVTGSTRGIGLAIAHRLLDAGMDLAVHGRQAEGPGDEAARALLAEAASRGRRALRFSADIADKAAVGRLLDEISAAFGRLDVLVLNAARAPFKETWRLLERDLRLLVDTNVLGNVFLVQKSLPLLEARGGSIVFLSSLGSRAMSPQYPLGPMKAAMEAMIRHWAEEFRSRRIRSNAVCAGLVRTDAFKTLRRIWPSVDRLPESLFVTPEEVADAVAFLAGPESRGVNGQTLVVDRGLSNRHLRDDDGADPTRTA